MKYIGHKKYVIFAPDFYPMPGGIASYTLQLAKAFHRSGKLAYLFTNHFQPEQYEFPCHSLKSNWRHQDHSKKSMPIRKLGSFIYRIRVHLFLYNALLSIFRKKKRELLLVNSIFIDLTWWMIRFSKKLKISYAIVLHGLDILELKKKNKRWLLLALQDANHLIVNSHSTQSLLIREITEISLPPISVIHPPFDKSAYDSIGPKPIGELFDPQLQDQQIICSICRLVERKGIDLAIRGVASLMKQNDNWTYLIAGEGDERKKLEKLVSELQLENKIIFLGTISDFEKFNLLRSSQIFIMPNHTLQQRDIEGFGISFVEAQYFKNVVIGGKSGGVLESVQDGHTGYLVDFEKDPIQQIQTYLDELTNNPEKLKKMGQHAHEFVTESFELEKLIGKLLISN